MPTATHCPADRYLDGFTEEERNAILKKYVPNAFPRPDGGLGEISNAWQCLEMMKLWEDILKGDDFQNARRNLWNIQGISHVARLRKLRNLVCKALQDVLLLQGYAEGQPGLTRC